MSSSSEDCLVEEVKPIFFEDVKVSNLGYVPRPGFGTVGKYIKIKANLYAVKRKGAAKKVIHYDVDFNSTLRIKNQKKSPALLKSIWEELYKQESQPGRPSKAVFDAIAFDAIPFQGIPPYVFDVTPRKTSDRSEEEDVWRAMFKPAAELDMSLIWDFCKGVEQGTGRMEKIYTIFQSCQVMFRHDLVRNFVVSGADGNRYFSSAKRIDLGGGGEVAEGFFMSLRATQAGFPHDDPGPLLKVASRLLGKDITTLGEGRRSGGSDNSDCRKAWVSLNPVDIQYLKRMLKGANFKVTHRDSEKTYTLGSFSIVSAAQHKFEQKDEYGCSTQTSVVDYFMQNYNVALKYPGLPLVQEGVDSRRSKGMIPMELVEILPNHPIPPTRLSADQAANMIKQAVKPPPDRAHGIEAWRSRLKFEKIPKVARWSLDVDKNMMVVDGRVLPPPRVLYGKQKTQCPTKGCWNMTQGQNFVKPGKKIKSWGVISFDPYFQEENAQPFMTFLITVLQTAGMTVEEKNPPFITRDLRQESAVKDGLNAICKSAWTKSNKMDPQIILVIIPRRDKAQYEEIKKISISGLRIPVITQCLVGNFAKDKRRRAQYCGNISMKICAKLGGVTHTIGKPDLPGVTNQTIIIGADVTHPPQKVRDGVLSPSIAVCCATTDGTQEKYRAQIRIQDSRTEIIQDLQEMVQQLLKDFRNSNNDIPPNHIIFYRDGVSEGQYQHVLASEVRAIRDACTSIDINYKPKLTWVICAKRHHVRFFGNGLADVDKTGNLPPGTIVDSGATHPLAFDFYLQAHGGLKGTARPTHYILLVDDYNFKPDDFQALTNNLCYGFARATRAVSLCPPAYYADIICTAVRPLVYEDNALEASTTLSIGETKKLVNLPFDPLRVSKLLQSNPLFGTNAWYL